MPHQNKLTPEQVDKLLKSLPEGLDTAQVTALVLTIVDGYLSTSPGDAISVLLTGSITYARVRGVSENRIIRTLRDTAEYLENSTANSKKVH